MNLTVHGTFVCSPHGPYYFPRHGFDVNNGLNTFLDTQFILKDARKSEMMSRHLQVNLGVGLARKLLSDPTSINFFPTERKLNIRRESKRQSIGHSDIVYHFSPEQVVMRGQPVFLYVDFDFF